MEHILFHVAEVARRAGEAIMQARREGFTMRTKEGNTPVTDADVRANEIIRHGLAQYTWPILSEESVDDVKRLDAEYVWIVDPLDGTKALVEGGEDFCVMIGLVKGGKTELAVVYQPSTDKLYTALRGGGAFLTIGAAKTKLQVSNISESAQARFIGSRHHHSPAVDALVRALGISHIVRASSNGVKIGSIAEGRFELLYNPTDKMSEWDICAPQLILEEAGGRVTGARGEELLYNKMTPQNPYGIIASNGFIHKEALRNVRMIVFSPDDGKVQGIVLWLTGLSGSGKTTIAEALKAKLSGSAMRVYVIDGDAVRNNDGQRLRFSREDIRENNRRIAELAREKSMEYDVVLVPVIAPYEEDRIQNRAIIGKQYVEVFVDCPLAVCEERDVKGLYKKARRGEITDLIGVSPENPYEKPIAPNIVIDTSTATLEEGVEALIKQIPR